MKEVLKLVTEISGDKEQKVRGKYEPRIANLAFNLLKLKLNINIIYSCKHNQIIKLNFKLFLLLNSGLIRFYVEIYWGIKF